MKTINSDQINKAEKYIKKNCRDLEKVRFDYLFGGGSQSVVVDELKKFQNQDGGFGNGLEPDFLLPDSSPMATTIAFQFLDEIDKPDGAAVKKAIKYFEGSFVKERQGWFTVPEKVNNYPHTGWWHWDTNEKQTVIDQSWGNPTAEIVGYLNKYQRLIATIDLDALTEYTIKYWEDKNDFPSEHEVYCFIRLYNQLQIDKANRLKEKLSEAAEKLVCLDPRKWNTYVPQPLQFENFIKNGITENLDYLVDTIGENGVWSPNWTWHQYKDIWPKQKVKWEGVITIHNLGILKKYNRIIE